MRLLVLLLLAGCAAQPISESPIPQADLAACQSISEQAMQYRALERGAVESARASGVAYGVTQIAPVALSAVLPYIAAGYAITSAVNGQIEAQDKRDSIVVQCLRDKGHKVY